MPNEGLEVSNVRGISFHSYSVIQRPRTKERNPYFTRVLRDDCFVSQRDGRLLRIHICTNVVCSEPTGVGNS